MASQRRPSARPPPVPSANGDALKVHQVEALSWCDNAGGPLTRSTTQSVRTICRPTLLSRSGMDLTNSRSTSRMSSDRSSQGTR